MPTMNYSCLYLSRYGRINFVVKLQRFVTERVNFRGSRSVSENRENLHPTKISRCTVCRTNFRYRVAHDWIPYANNTSSGTWKVFIDQYDYQNLVGGYTPARVWSAVQFSPDSDR